MEKGSYTFLDIFYHDNLYFVRKRIAIIEKEKEEIINLLNSYVEPKGEEIILKSGISKFVIDGLTWWFIGKALDPLFEKAKEKIKEILLKDPKRKMKYEYEKSKRV